jgi:NAD(P) transhydrogenase subunit alpha
MKLAVLRETAAGERRVALVPESVKKLTAAGFSVCVEAGAGESAYFSDELYTAAGATIEQTPAKVIEGAGMVLKIGIPTTDGPRNEIDLLQSGQMLLGSLMPTRNPRVILALAERGVTAFSTDAIPRTTRAQAMDTLSSMANIVGYKGILLGAIELAKYCPMFMTAAGTIFPAKIFVIGAGVAGLQAIATGKRLGGQMFATDVRPEVKEQIESVGAKYVGIELAQSASAGGGYAKELSAEDKAKQREMLVQQCAVSDMVVTTALIGGVFAPKLITAEMVRKMKPGSVIVDLASGGGRELRADQAGDDGGGQQREDPRAAEHPVEHAERREHAVVAEHAELPDGVLEGQEVQPGHERRHSEGRGGRARGRGDARQDEGNTPGRGGLAGLD